MINEKQHTLVVVFLLAVFCVLSLYTAINSSTTTDEYPHYYAGLNFWKGEGKSNLEHPPLVKLIATLPAFIFNLDFEEGLLFARLIIILSGILLGFVIYLFSKELFGKNSALFSLALFSFSPMFISLSSLLIMDIPMALFGMLSTLFFIKYLNGADNKINIILSGVFLGLAMLSRFSAGLIAFGFIASVLIFKRNDFKKKIVDSIFIIYIGIAIMVIFFVIFDFNIFVPSLTEGLSYGFSHVKGGHASYLMGVWSNGSFPLYYLIGIILKTPLSFLALFIGLLFYLKNPEEKQLLVITIIGIILISLFNSINIGVRHAILFYPLACILAGNLILRGKKIVKYLAVALLLLFITESLFIAPNYLGYFNQIAGNDAHYFLIDSNLEWGQYDKEVKAYLEMHTDVKRVDSCELKQGKYLISANELHGRLNYDFVDCDGSGWQACGYRFTFNGENCFEELRGKEPIEILNNAWFVYEVV